MAYKEVADLNPDNTISLGGTNRKTNKKNPTEVEGYYLGSRTVEDKKKKNGVSYIHVFQTPKGTIGVWGKTDMDRKILTLTAGVMTKVTFDRMVNTPNGEMYKYKVATDDDNTTEVGGAGNAAQSFSSAGEDAGGEEEEGSVYDPEEEVEEAPDYSPGRKSAAASQERVAAILNKGKSK